MSTKGNDTNLNQWEEPTNSHKNKYPSHWLYLLIKGLSTGKHLASSKPRQNFKSPGGSHGSETQCNVEEFYYGSQALITEVK